MADDTAKRPSQALGLIEVRGLAAAIEAADAMVKSAYVGQVLRQQPGGGLQAVIVRGDVGSVQAAVAAGAAAASKVGKVLSAQVIARPDDALEGIMERPPVR